MTKILMPSLNKRIMRIKMSKLKLKFKCLVLILFVLLIAFSAFNLYFSKQIPKNTSIPIIVESHEPITDNLILKSYSNNSASKSSTSESSTRKTKKTRIFTPRPSTNSTKKTTIPTPAQPDAYKIHRFYDFIKEHEHKYFSQNGEDGVIVALTLLFDFKNKTYVEIGADIGMECNTRYIHEFYKWDGVLFDARVNFAHRKLYDEVITHQNVLKVLDKYNITDFDLLSEDTDYADYWIVEKILTKFRPKMVIHEVNEQPPELCVAVKKPAEVIFWTVGEYHGGSVCAFYCLAKRFGYTMVYCEKAGVNCFWIRNDYLESYLKVKAEVVQSILKPEYLYHRPRFDYDKSSDPWHRVKCQM